MKKILLIIFVLFSLIFFSKTPVELEVSTNFELLGDFNGDNVVDLLDMSLFGKHYRETSSDPDFDEMYDISGADRGIGVWENVYCISNPDGKIDLLDFSIFGKNYRKTKPNEFTSNNALYIVDNLLEKSSGNQVSIFAKEITDLKGIQFEIYYDTEYFEEVKEPDISILNFAMQNWSSVSNFDVSGRIVYALAGKTPVNITGENIIQITFTTKNNTGTTEITFGSETKCSDSSNQNLFVGISDIGNIKIQ